MEKHAELVNAANPKKFAMNQQILAIRNFGIYRKRYLPSDKFNSKTREEGQFRL